MKLVNEDSILKKEFRLKVIKWIQSGGNQKRKAEAKKRREVYKDNTVEYVLKKLKAEGLKSSTIQLMENRASNISICRKVIDKLARCYNGGVQRDAGSETLNEILNSLEQYFEFDQKQKKIDRYRKLHKNALSLIVPDEKIEYSKVVFGIKKKTLTPEQFDVLEDPKDPEKMKCLILNDFQDETLLGVPISSDSITATANNQGAMASRSGQKQTFIWWSDNYHFTTDEKGEIIALLSPEGNLNPIEEIPAVTYAEDQDGCYWATGGQDLVDGSILVNTLLTDLFAIAFIQGWGQFVITGSKVPDVMTGGPHNAIVLKYDKDEDAKPEVNVVNANPPLADWMKMIEQLVALLLSTNNLSPSSVSVSLDAANYPSGIAMLIEKSEATAPVEEAQKQFRTNERKEWDIIRKWINLFESTKSLDEELSLIGAIPEDFKPTTKFMDSKEVVTEKERLDNIKLRQEIGLNTEIELIKLDRPDLKDDEAQKKLLEIKLERAEKMATEGAHDVETENDKKIAAEKETDDKGKPTKQKDKNKITPRAK